MLWKFHIWAIPFHTTVCISLALQYLHSCKKVIKSTTSLNHVLKWKPLLKWKSCPFSLQIMIALFTLISFEESTLTGYKTMTLVKWRLIIWRTVVHFLQRVSRSKKNGSLNYTAMKISKLVPPQPALHNSW